LGAAKQTKKQLLENQSQNVPCYRLEYLYASEKEANQRLLELKRDKVVSIQNEIFELEKKIEGLRW
jgi:hypothetical protein